MKRTIRLAGAALALGALLAFSFGCKKDIPPPTPLAVEELPATLEKAFVRSAPGHQDLAKEVAAAVRAQDYSKAFVTMQKLSAQAGLTTEQQTVVNRASLTLNELLQAAQAKGDQKAAQTVNNYLKLK